MLSFCSLLDNFWHSSLAGRAWVSEQAIRASFPIPDVPRNRIRTQLKLYSWFNVQMQLAYLCFAWMPGTAQAGLEGPGEEDLVSVQYIRASLVEHLPSPFACFAGCNCSPEGLVSPLLTPEGK